MLRFETKLSVLASVAKVVLEKVYKSFSSSSKEPTEPLKVENLGIPTQSTSSEQKVKRDRPKLNKINVLRSINLTVEDGELMVLVGPSGCGKSTLLRVIAGLEELTGGNIWIGDRLVNNLLPKERDLAMVFQNYALYPHLRVYDNIAFGLRRMEIGRWGKGEMEKNISSSTPSWIENLLVGMTRSLPLGWRYLSSKEKFIARRVGEVSKLLQIDTLLDRFPKQLSGGQKQRVALGRAIARNPQAFLMDEPLSNLDAQLRTETRTQIVKLQRQLGTTTIYVTHDRTEAMTMGDRIAVMDRGQIQQIAPPLEIYNRPANRFVAEFIGSPPMNFIEVRVKTPLLINHALFSLTLPQTWAKFLEPYEGRSLLLGIRPEHLSISSPAPQNLPVQVDLVEALGNDTYISVSLRESPDSCLQARITPELVLQAGESIWLSMASDKIHLFEPETGRAIWQS